ncbi:MAG: ADP-ribosylglycohydrolase, partial [Paucimonas sp.]|nr:ADP-ribosylglycohydrolase [Paucimonas sp.]
MLLEIAIGDAYGAGFEFSHREKIDRHNDLSAFVPHELGIAAGHYTDDTQMSIAVAETMISGGPLSSDTFADAFVRCYRRDPRKGYATGFQALLDACKDGAALRQRIRPDSRRNGAAMRAVPLGLIANKQELLAAASAQARVTHDTAEGVISAQIVALMANLLLYQRMPLVQLPSAILAETGFGMRLDWDADVKCDAGET